MSVNLPFILVAAAQMNTAEALAVASSVLSFNACERQKA